MFPPDSVLHVINRGVERRALFRSAQDYEDFLYLAERTQRVVPLRVLAYALMPNHWHLVVWPQEIAVLSQYLHHLTAGHAQRLRWLTSTKGLGHVYQNRFKAFAIESDDRYMNTLRYVEANALRAGLVHAAEDWPWSSLFERLTRRRRIVTDGPVSLPPIDQWIDLVNKSTPGTGPLRNA